MQLKPDKHLVIFSRTRNSLACLSDQPQTSPLAAAEQVSHRPTSNTITPSSLPKSPNLTTDTRLISFPGNIRTPAPKPATSNDADLATPTLKQNKYTTGRGGSGNIVSGDSKASRSAQDVEPVARSESKVGSTVLHGRGGGGNAHKVTQSEEQTVEEEQALKKTESRPSNGVKERKGSLVGRVVDKIGRRRTSDESKRTESVGSRGSSVISEQ